MAAMDEKPEIIDRIAVRTGSKIQVIPADEILYLEADGDYVRIHTNDRLFPEGEDHEIFRNTSNSFTVYKNSSFVYCKY